VVGYVNADSAAASLIAAGLGAGAFGFANNNDIQANADNSFQFGPGVNDEPNTLAVGTFFRIKGTDGAPGTPRVGDVWPDVAEDALVLNSSLLPPDDNVAVGRHRLGNLEHGATPAIIQGVGGTFPINLLGGGDEFVDVTTAAGTSAITIPDSGALSISDLVTLFNGYFTADNNPAIMSNNGGQLRLESLDVGPGAFVSISGGPAPIFEANAGFTFPTTEIGVSGEQAGWLTVEGFGGKFVHATQTTGGVTYVLDLGASTGAYGGLIAGQVRADGADSIATLERLVLGAGTLGPAWVTGTAVAQAGAVSKIVASGVGSVSTGYAFADGAGVTATVVATGAGSFAGGYANAAAGEAAILAGGIGSLAQGYALNGSITASGAGAHAGGYADGGTITSSGVDGGLAWGLAYSFDGIAELTNGSGGALFGRATSSTGGTAAVTLPGAIGTHGFISGLATANAPLSNALITADGESPFVVGFASSSSTGSATVNAQESGAILGGAISIAAFDSLVTTGPLAFAIAIAQANTANATASATGLGAMVVGYALDTDIVASADNAVQFGPGTNAVADSLQVGANWSARADGRTASKNAPVTLGAAATTFAAGSSFVVVTGDAGANVVATITGGFEGMRLILLFVDALVTITDDNGHGADTVDLSAAFTSADDAVLELIHDGTSWYEIGRSVN
jgi:hypothetical protein